MRATSLFLFAIVAGCSSSSGADPSAASDGGDDAAADLGGDAADDASNDDATSDASETSGDGGASGCGKPAKTGVSANGITVGTAARTYLLSVPTSYDPSKAYPLVFAWHGRTGNGAHFRSYAGVENAAAGNAIFVYPDGLPVTSNPKDTGWVLSASGRDVALFDALLSELSSKLCVDRARVFSFGYSFGGYMSNALGCFRSKELRAIGVVASGGPSATCGDPVRAWIAHSEDDPVVAFSEGVKTRDVWTNENGCGTTTSAVPPDPCVAYAGCTAAVHWCARKTGGHGWPPFAATGIWGFFAAD